MAMSSPVERNLVLDVGLNSSVLCGESVIMEERNKQMIQIFIRMQRKLCQRLNTYISLLIIFCIIEYVTNKKIKLNKNLD